MLFKEKSGEESTAQIQAFTDFWRWDVQALHAYNYLIHDAPNEAVGKLVLALNIFLGKTDILAYVVMSEYIIRITPSSQIDGFNFSSL